MTTLTLEIQLPENIELSEHDAKRLFVAKLYEEGIVSIGRGAEMLGMTYREFYETFGFYCRMTSEDLEEELKVGRSFVNREAVRQAKEQMELGSDIAR